jgi:hypothetical protein
MPTPVPCNHFPSNTWIHLVWKLERVGDQVHYLSVSVADQTYTVDTYYTAQPNWYQEDRRRFPDGGQLQTGAV